MSHFLANPVTIISSNYYLYDHNSDSIHLLFLQCPFIINILQCFLKIN